MKTSIEEVFERALEEILARVFSSGPCHSLPSFALAYSGGLDSTVLLWLMRGWAGRHGVALHAFHIHHGLSPNADAWLAHCTAQAALAGVSFESRGVQVLADGQGIEQAARVARYRALGELCMQHGMPFLLTAHHLDDQAETVFLQLMRGAGVAGLSGMERANHAPGLLGSPDLWMARPLLDLGREELRTWAEAAGLAWVEDESNSDPRYARNRLRQTIMPALGHDFPGFQRRIARAASHAAAAHVLLDELAAEDMQRCGGEDGLDLTLLKSLSEVRFNNLLRHWFARRSVRMPSVAWLAQLRKQVFAAGADARVRITHPDCEVWRYRNRLLLAPRIDASSLQAAPMTFAWEEQDELRFQDFHGRLLFERGAGGIDAQWLRGRPLTLRHRRGGEQVKIAANRSTRDLKHHFQALGVPPWERCRLPVVTYGERLVFAAGIGLNVSAVPLSDTAGVKLCWASDSV